MSTARYVHWQDGEMWLGYFEEYPDYLTQGETVEELQIFATFIAISPAARFLAFVEWLNCLSDETNRLGSQIGGGRMSPGPPRRKSWIGIATQRPAYLSRCPGIGRSTNSSQSIS